MLLSAPNSCTRAETLPPHTTPQTPAKRSLLGRFWSTSEPHEFAVTRTFFLAYIVVALALPFLALAGSWALGVRVADVDPWLMPIGPFLILFLGQALPAIPKHGTVRIGVALRLMAQKLPWFAGLPVTFAAIPEDSQLDEQLRDHGYQRLTLEGSAIQSWRDLTDALAAVTSPSSVIADERRYAFHLLAQLSTSRPRTALVWRNAAASSARAPYLLADICAAWSSQATIVGGGLLVLIDTGTDEASATAPADATSRRDGEGASWWTPSPGELTR